MAKHDLSYEQVMQLAEKIMEGSSVEVPSMAALDDLALQLYQTHGQYLMYKTLGSSKISVKLLDDELTNLIKEWQYLPFDQDVPSKRNYCNICKNDDSTICTLCGGKEGNQ